MLGAGGPALGVFLLGSLMWNADLSWGPGVGRAHPIPSFRLHFCSAPLSSNLETMPVFLPWCFGLTWKGWAPEDHFDNQALQFLGFPALGWYIFVACCCSLRHIIWGHDILLDKCLYAVYKIPPSRWPRNFTAGVQSSGHKSPISSFF